MSGKGGIIMKYYKEIILKDGRKCILRNGTEQDGAAALENFILTHKQTDYLLSCPDEIKFTAEDEAQYLKEKFKSENEIEIIAEINGMIIGTAGIECVGNRYKTRHRAEFGISIDEEYRGLGAGRAMTEACIECAKKAGYVQLELNAVAGNERAINLYKKLGFKEFGRNPKGFRSRSGGWQETVYMYLEL